MAGTHKEKVFHDDLFHSVTMCEDNSWQEGYMEGKREGGTKGFAEGYALGAEKGAEIGAEVGFYEGYAAHIFRLKQDEDRKTRTVKVCEAIIKLAATFADIEPTDEALSDNLNNIRGKFKQLTSLLGVQVEYTTTFGKSMKGISF